MSIEVWAKTLYLYGPFAILLFLAFVTEKKARTAWQESTKSDKPSPVFVGLYALNWIAMIAVAMYSVYAWKQVNLDRPPEIWGTIQSLPEAESLSTSFDDLYLRKIPKNVIGTADYEWLLFNKDKRRKDGETITFTLKEFDYDLPIQSDFYQRKVRLRRENDDIFLFDQSKPLVKRKGLTPQPKPPATQPTQLSDLFTRVAYAESEQESYSFEDIAVGLQSPDTVVRRQARVALANMDQATALDWIDRVLPSSSYRLRLGVIVALNNMPNLSREALTLKTNTVGAIQKALTDPDATLRNEAFNLATKYKLVPVIVFQDINYSGKAQGFGPGAYRADKGQLRNLPNDSSSSIFVAPGYVVRLCENEGAGNGSGHCETIHPGWKRLGDPRVGGVADQVSFIQVQPIKPGLPKRRADR